MAALSGMKVLDLTQYEAGPACTQALAAFGADVVKVEPPGRGDTARTTGHGSSTHYSNFFCAWNANKRSLAVDLAAPAGRKVLLRLLQTYDVLVENYGPGSMERLDLGYETLSALNPRLIYARIKGFGVSGPYASFRSMDPTAQAVAGAFSINGEVHGPPLVPGPTIADAGTGVLTALAVLAACAQRERTGEGQLIELSMQEAMTFYLRREFFFRSKLGAHPASRVGARRGLPPAGLYPCKGGGPNDYIYLQPSTDAHWEALCAAIGRLDLFVDRRFYSVRWRIQNSGALRKEIRAWTLERTKHEAMETIGRAGVPCSACLDTVDLHRDGHLSARGFIEQVDLPIHGSQRMLGFAPPRSKARVEMKRAPLLGEHTDELLREELDLSDADVEELRAEGIIEDSAAQRPETPGSS